MEALKFVTVSSPNPTSGIAGNNTASESVKHGSRRPSGIEAEPRAHDAYGAKVHPASDPLWGVWGGTTENQSHDRHQTGRGDRGGARADDHVQDHEALHAPGRANSHKVSGKEHSTRARATGRPLVFEHTNEPNEMRRERYVGCSTSTERRFVYLMHVRGTHQVKSGAPRDHQTLKGKTKEIGSCRLPDITPGSLKKGDAAKYYSRAEGRDTRDSKRSTPRRRPSQIVQSPTSRRQNSSASAAARGPVPPITYWASDRPEGFGSDIKAV